jgi:hypothetical protein
LDELMGVSNNKQTAVHLALLSTLGLEEWAAQEGYQSIQGFKEALRNAGDPRLSLVEVIHTIRATLKDIREQLLKQRIATRTRKRHEVESAEARATDATRLRQQRGIQGVSDAGEAKDDTARVDELRQGLIGLGAEPTVANDEAQQTVAQNRKFLIQHQSLDSASFFSVRHMVGVIVMVLNIDHPAYSHLIELLEDPPATAEINSEVLRDRLTRCHDGLKLLIEAWARFEDELPDSERVRAQDFRNDWGRVAREFLST